MTRREFDYLDRHRPEQWEAWLKVCQEQRLDPWRSRLAAGEIVEVLRTKGLHLNNQYKPHYARKFNRLYGEDGGLTFVCHRSIADQPA